MDKIKLSTEDIEFILKWRDEHKDLVRFGASPLKAVKIVCYETGYTITAVRNGRELSFGINQNGRSLGKLVFDTSAGGMYVMTKNTTKLSDEDRQSVITVYASTMAILVFGRTTIRSEENDARELRPPKKNKKRPQKSKRSGYTYILSRRGKEPTLMAKGTHRSPSTEFSVRGHFRHYKSGKVIWIEEFVKGSGKRSDKTYKINSKP